MIWQGGGLLGYQLKQYSIAHRILNVVNSYELCRNHDRPVSAYILDLTVKTRLIGKELLSGIVSAYFP